MQSKDKMFDISPYLAENEPEAATIRYMHSSGYTQKTPHLHQHYELHFVTKGEYTIECCGRILRGSEPRVTIFCPFTMHRVTVPEGTDYKRLIISFTKQLENEISPALLNLAPLRHANMLSLIPDDSTRDELQRLTLQCWNYRNHRPYRTLTAAMVIARVLDLFAAGSGEIISGSFTYIHDALQYMAEHLSEAPSALTLAEKYGVSKTKFHADFRETTGSSYRSYLTEMRMSCAKNLLTAGASIVECSFETGYSGEASFIAAFRQYFGITPGEFRRTLRKQQKNPAG